MMEDPPRCIKCVSQRWSQAAEQANFTELEDSAIASALKLVLQTRTAESELQMSEGVIG